VERITDRSYWLQDFEITLLGMLGLVTVMAAWDRPSGKVVIRRVLPGGSQERFPLDELSTRMLKEDIPDAIPFYNDSNHYLRAERKVTFEFKNDGRNDSVIDSYASSAVNSTATSDAAAAASGTAAAAASGTAAAAASGTAAAAASGTAAGPAASVTVYKDFTRELMRSHTVSERKRLDDAFGHHGESEEVVCRLFAGAGGSTVDILGKHMAR
jgi:hypothetical protein